MTSIPFVTRRALGRLLAAAAFVAVVASTGCSVCPGLGGGGGATADASGSDAAGRKHLKGSQDPWQDTPGGAGGAEVVNVFGEFGGVTQIASISGEMVAYC